MPPDLPARASRGHGWIHAPRRLLVLLLRAYQAVVSPALPVIFGAGAGCRFAPTCSHYAVEALQQHGLRGGLRLALARLARCHPFHPGGLDPVPAAPRCVRVS